MPESDCSSYTSINLENKINAYKEIEGFEIALLENRTLLRISYKEYKPYYVSTRLLNSFKFKNFGMKDFQSSFFGLFQTKIEKKKQKKSKD